MTFRDLLFDTLKTLWAHKLRTFLTMFGIAWGIVSITLMVAAGEGLRVGQAMVADAFSKDLLIIHAGRTSLQAGGGRAGRRIWFRAGDYQFVQEQSPACRLVMPELGNMAMVRSRYNNGSFLVAGSLPEFSYFRTLPIAEGRFYTGEDEAQGRSVAFLGTNVRDQLFKGRAAVGETILIRGLPYTVIGVMRKKEQDSDYDGRDVEKVFIPFSAVLRDLPNRAPAPADSVDRLLASARSLAEHEACKRQVVRALAVRYGFDPRDEEAADVWDTVREQKAFRQMTDGMKYFLGAVGLTTLFLGGIGVMNVMLVAVRERTREIGVRKAVGATRRSILTQFFIETLIVVFLSGGGGMAFAFSICAAVNTLPMPMFFAGLLPSWQSTLFSFAVLGTVALLAAMYPANRAASVGPIEALRYEPGS